MGAASDGKQWFSATLRILVLVGRPPVPDHYYDLVVVLRADDFAAATERALALGFGKEETYEAISGDLVEWRFKEITTLDVVLDDELDGAEVLCRSRPLDAAETGANFDPRASQPAQTI